MSEQSSPSPKRQSSVKKSSTISTTTFFFKSKPKRLLSNVKRMLAFEEGKDVERVEEVKSPFDKVTTTSSTTQYSTHPEFIDLSDEVSTREILPIVKRKVPILTFTPESDEIMIPDIDPLLRKALEQKSKSSSTLNTFSNLSPINLIVHDEFSNHQKVHRYEYQILPVKMTFFYLTLV